MASRGKRRRATLSLNSFFTMRKRKSRQWILVGGAVVLVLLIAGLAQAYGSFLTTTVAKLRSQKVYAGDQVKVCRATAQDTVVLCDSITPRDCGGPIRFNPDEESIEVEIPSDFKLGLAYIERRSPGNRVTRQPVTIKDRGLPTQNYNDYKFSNKRIVIPEQGTFVFPLDAQFFYRTRFDGQVVDRRVAGNQSFRFQIPSYATPEENHRMDIARRVERGNQVRFRSLGTQNLYVTRSSTDPGFDIGCSSSSPSPAPSESATPSSTSSSSPSPSSSASPSPDESPSPSASPSPSEEASPSPSASESPLPTGVLYDNFAGPRVINVSTGFPYNQTTRSFTIFGKNKGATKEPGEPNHGGNPGGASIWIKWVSIHKFDGSVVTLDTFGSTFDTLLAVYEYTNANGLQLVRENDDANQNGRSRVTFTIKPSRTYYIAIDGKDGAEGVIRLNSSLPRLVPITP